MWYSEYCVDINQFEKNNTYVPYILTFAPQITSGNAPGKTKSIENLADLKFWSPNEWYFATKNTYVF